MDINTNFILELLHGQIFSFNKDKFNTMKFEKLLVTVINEHKTEYKNTNNIEKYAIVLIYNNIHLKISSLYMELEMWFEHLSQCTPKELNLLKNIIRPFILNQIKLFKTRTIEINNWVISNKRTYINVNNKYNIGKEQIKKECDKITEIYDDINKEVCKHYPIV